MHKKLVIAIALIFFSAGVTAQSSNWNIDTLNEPENMLELTNGSEDIKLVRLTDADGDPVNRSRLDNDAAELYFSHNLSNERDPMEYLYNGYYYHDRGSNSSQTKAIHLLEDDSSDGFWETQNQTLRYGNLSIGDVSAPTMLKSEAKYSYRFNVEDIWNNVNLSESEGTLKLTFTNGSWSSSQEINNYNSEEEYFYNYEVEAPPQANTTYIMNLKATSSKSIDNGFGSNSRFIETLPAIETKIEYLDTPRPVGCDSESFPEACESNTTLNTGLNVTESSAENVNLSVMKLNTTGSWILHDEMMLQKSEGLYRGSWDVPELNSSKYDKIQLVYNASNDRRKSIQRHNISYETFRIADRSNFETDPGSYTVKIAARSYFRLDPIMRSNINGTVNVTDQNGEPFSSFSLDEMEYDNERDLFLMDLSIPTDAEKGAVYSKQINITDKFGTQKTLGAPETEFRITNKSESFNVGSDFETDIVRTGDYSYNLTLESFVSDVVLETRLGDEIEDFATVNSGNDIELNDTGIYDIKLDLNVSYVDDYSSEIMFIDPVANYNKTMSVDINGRSCTARTDVVCLETNEVLGLDVDEETIGELKEFSVSYMGNWNSSESFDASVTGNISSVIELSDEEFSFDPENTTREAYLNYSIESPGYRNGTLNIGDLSYTLRSQSNIETVSVISFSVPSSITLESREKEIEFANTGEADIDAVRFEGSDTQVTAESKSVAAGESTSFDLSFEERVSGTLTVIVESGEREQSAEIEVDAGDRGDSYSSKINNARNRVTRLDQQVSNPELQSTIDSARRNLTRIESAYRRGNTAEADQMYNQLNSRLDTVEIEMSRTGGDDTGSDTGSNDNTGQNPDQNSGGTSSFIPIAAGVFFLIIIGFVVATSIEPEEGDPLYDVLN